MEKEYKRTKTRGKRLRYMPGLDGLRAIAVIGIIIYHLNKQWLTGGFWALTHFCYFRLSNNKFIIKRV